VANFINPFPGITETKPMSASDLVRALRLDLAAEEEAVHLYTAHAEATDNLMAQTILQDIANEERVHAGEFLTLIEALTDEGKFLEEGKEEVERKFPSIRAGYRASHTLPTDKDLEQLLEKGEEHFSAISGLYVNLSEAERAEHPKFNESLLGAMKNLTESQESLTKAKWYLYRIKTFGAEQRGTIAMPEEQ
jgi:rubrerythrin